MDPLGVEAIGAKGPSTPILQLKALGFRAYLRAYKRGLGMKLYISSRVKIRCPEPPFSRLEPEP